MSMRAAPNANLTYYLDTRGCIAPLGGHARRLAEFMTHVVAEVTMAAGWIDLPLRPIHCRRIRCQGMLAIQRGEEVIDWHCQHCGDRGSITHWRNTFWDLLDTP